MDETKCLLPVRSLDLLSFRKFSNSSGILLVKPTAGTIQHILVKMDSKDSYGRDGVPFANPKFRSFIISEIFELFGNTFSKAHSANYTTYSGKHGLKRFVWTRRSAFCQSEVSIFFHFGNFRIIREYFQ